MKECDKWCGLCPAASAQNTQDDQETENKTTGGGIMKYKTKEMDKHNTGCLQSISEKFDEGNWIYMN